MHGDLINSDNVELIDKDLLGKMVQSSLVQVSLMHYRNMMLLQ